MPFYRRHFSGRPARSFDETGELDGDVEALARTLAAYGWIGFPLAPEPDAARTRGVWIGVWRLEEPTGAGPETLLDPTDPAGPTVTPPLFYFFNSKREGKKDVDRAEAFLEFGTTLAGEGDLVDRRPVPRALAAVERLAGARRWSSCPPSSPEGPRASLSPYYRSQRRRCSKFRAPRQPGPLITAEGASESGEPWMSRHGHRRFEIPRTALAPVVDE